MSENKKRTAAVVVTTYNNPKSLELCLLSLAEQTFQNFEIFIADDGSGDETRDLLLRMKLIDPVQIYHYWHPDMGYRKAKINNNVFRELSPERYAFVICVDHDVILHPRFVEDHYREHEKAKFKALLFMGRRVDLSPSLTAKLNTQTLHQFTQGLSFKLIASSLKGETKNVLRSVRVAGPDWLVHLLKRDRVWDLLGSNYSVTTETLLQVNGYNEDFKSYWGEDGDLFVRLRNLGTQIYGRIGYAIQWHIFHKRLDETKEHVDAYQSLLMDTSYTVCENGIRKLRAKTPTSTT
jgi:glycosyltransferase involved in cell wall biosynthesis